jgi:hypothetical protein
VKKGNKEIGQNFANEEKRKAVERELINSSKGIN